jgi:hypothetical protein
MIKLNQVTPTYGDETAGYEVILDKEYTVKELLNTVLDNKEEWGTFYVKGGSKCEYSYGNCKSKLKEDDLDKKVISVRGRGGWSNMTYIVITS